ncbi:hypothetical protein, partial [Akkermansia muciniphila]|uniref:hypothetical protein n=1 Tax=Akkermansia muciniphila TaxID=239935 RepID=UPI001C9B7D49
VGSSPTGGATNFLSPVILMDYRASFLSVLRLERRKTMKKQPQMITKYHFLIPFWRKIGVL